MSLLDTFISASDYVVEFEAYFSALPETGHTVHTLEVQKDEILERWKSFRSSYESLLDGFDTLEEEEPSLEAAKQRFYRTFEAHVRVLSKANKMLDLFCQKSSPPIIPSTEPPKIPVELTPNISLPPCDTETFYGDYVSWPTFRDLFTALYKNNPRLSSIEKLCHLLKKTQGEAHDILKTCPLTNDGFEMAWKNLVERYENKRVLINAQLKSLFNLSPIYKESGPSIKGIQRTINDCVTNLTLLEIETKNWDVIFVYICSTCLPETTLHLWEQSLKDSSKLPSWKDMDSFLTTRYQILESVADIRTTISNSNPPSRKPLYLKKSYTPDTHKKVNTFQTKVATDRQIKCTLCHDSHVLRFCPVFLKMSIENKFAIVKKQKRCTNCLSPTHEFKKCKSPYSCSICKQKHNSLLHRSESNAKSNQTPIEQHFHSAPAAQNHNANNVRESDTTQVLNTNPSTSAAAENIRQSFSTQIQSTLNDSIVLGTALVDICVNDVRCTARALIDSASEATFISKRLQIKLSLPTKSSQIEVLGLNGALTATSTQLCFISIGSPIDQTFKTSVEAFVVKKVTNQLPSHCPFVIQNSKFSDLHMADSHDNKSSQVDILLGGDVYPKVLRSGLRWDDSQNLVAQQTVFGWILTGRVNSSSRLQTVSTFYNEIVLNKQLCRFWELEEVPNLPRKSDEDIHCENLFQSTTYRNEAGRFVVSLPFKREYPADINLGVSRESAVSQFLRNESRLLKNPQLKSDYDKVITEYISLGHMTVVNPAAPTEDECHFPHHAVHKPDSTTTKLRVVFNASHPTSNGVSLNDVLLPGPVLQADLTILMLRWRLFRYVFNADIEKMYRQILLNPVHTSYQRIIFRASPDEKLQDYELKTVTFGVNCAPYLAIRTLLELANECESQYPTVSDILRNFMYVDDVLSGSHTLSQALKSRDELIKVLSSAGFLLRKWTANNEYLLKDLPTEHLLDAEFLKLSDSSTTKTLGLRWNAGSDHFYFRPKNNPDRTLVTKRSVLSEIAKLFDPAGWLAPKIIVAKMIMQQIWKDGTGWDEVIQPSTLHQWYSFLDDYPNIELIKIPRYVDYNPSYSIELHGFCDASEKAYAAALYMRSENDGFVSSHLLIAKTKVSPVKFVSLPRKELLGAELLAKMIDSVRSQLHIGDPKLFLWTDSTIVLSWLQKPANHWKTFVANRVEYIVDKVGSEAWNHVNSSNNPADLATRGFLASELASSDLWWNGPPWLRLPNTDWPVNSVNLETQEEKKSVNVHLTQVSDCDLLKNYFKTHPLSNLARAMRVFCYCFRFFHSLSRTHSHNHSSTELRQSEMKLVRSRLVMMAQKLYFSEYTLLSAGQKIPSKSSLLVFNPFIDSDGIMRVNGRLSQCPILSYDEKFPKLLPYSATFTRLYLKHLHICSIHGENALLMRLMRVEFWVPFLKNLVKTTVNTCRICVRHKHRKSQQIMAALPPERTTLSRPFTHTGVDFAGPFDVKSYIGRGCRITKGYVLVFVCFATKAIHLEVTSEISTAAFLAAFARFFSRRGSPSHIYSDNGTAFVGAANVLDCEKDQFLSLLKRNIISQHPYHSLEWHFIPPGAPHMGGLWEAGVKSFKSHLKKITHAQRFTFEEFSTMLARIEACLNSRPISAMSENPADTCALTPGHFLTGGPLLAPPEPDLSDLNISHVNRWQKLKVLHQNLARTWKEVYLKEMHKRTKWKYPQRDFEIGDFVIIRQDNLPPNQWRLGRVEKVIRGPDNRVRVAEVRTATGIVSRPIVKLVLLPDSEQN